MSEEELKVIGSMEGLKIKYKDDLVLNEILDRIIDYIYSRHESEDK